MNASVLSLSLSSSVLVHPNPCNSACSNFLQHHVVLHVLPNMNTENTCREELTSWKHIYLCALPSNWCGVSLFSLFIYVVYSNHLSVHCRWLAIVIVLQNIVNRCHLSLLHRMATSISSLPLYTKIDAKFFKIGNLINCEYGFEWHATFNGSCTPVNIHWCIWGLVLRIDSTSAINEGFEHALKVFPCMKTPKTQKNMVTSLHRELLLLSPIHSFLSIEPKC